MCVPIWLHTHTHERTNDLGVRTHARVYPQHNSYSHDMHDLQAEDGEGGAHNEGWLSL